jgi:hypothetical protein
MSTRLKPRPKPIAYVLTPAEQALYAPAVALVLRPSGDVDAPSAVLDVLDGEGALVRRVLVNGLPVSTRTLPLLIEPRGDGYHGQPPSTYETRHKGEPRGHEYKFL